MSTYVPGGYISPRGGPNSGSVFVNNPNGTRTFASFGPGTQANPFDGYSYQRENERVNAGGFVTLKLADALEFYG